ncbi:hypothetical protein Ancab_033493 [Ancistrocladus abbreviatus]
MGNCCGSSMVWAGEDWGSVAPKSTDYAEENQGLLGERSPMVGFSKEVKIRISRQRLEELLKRLDDGDGVSSGVGVRGGKRVLAQQVLARLIQNSEHFEIHHQRTWRPALQSIPEVE